MMEDILASAEAEINRQRLGIRRIDSFFTSAPGNKRSASSKGEDPFDAAIRNSRPAAKRKKKGKKKRVAPASGVSPLAKFLQ